jgi:DNA mismatch repair ATPase MutL
MRSSAFRIVPSISCSAIVLTSNSASVAKNSMINTTHRFASAAMQRRSLHRLCACSGASQRMTVQFNHQKSIQPFSTTTSESNTTTSNQTTSSSTQPQPDASQQTNNSFENAQSKQSKVTSDASSESKQSTSSQSSDQQQQQQQQQQNNRPKHNQPSPFSWKSFFITAITAGALLTYYNYEKQRQQTRLKPIEFVGRVAIGDG